MTGFVITISCDDFFTDPRKNIALYLNHSKMKTVRDLKNRIQSIIKQDFFLLWKPKDEVEFYYLMEDEEIHFIQVNDKLRLSKISETTRREYDEKTGSKNSVPETSSVTEEIIYKSKIENSVANGDHKKSDYDDELMEYEDVVDKGKKRKRIRKHKSKKKIDNIEVENTPVLNRAQHFLQTTDKDELLSNKSHIRFDSEENIHVINDLKKKTKIEIPQTNGEKNVLQKEPSFFNGESDISAIDEPTLAYSGEHSYCSDLKKKKHKKSKKRNKEKTEDKLEVKGTDIQRGICIDTVDSAFVNSCEDKKIDDDISFKQIFENEKIISTELPHMNGVISLKPSEKLEFSNKSSCLKIINVPESSSIVNKKKSKKPYVNSLSNFLNHLRQEVTVNSEKKTSDKKTELPANKKCDQINEGNLNISNGEERILIDVKRDLSPKTNLEIKQQNISLLESLNCLKNYSNNGPIIFERTNSKRVVHKDKAVNENGLVHEPKTDDTKMEEKSESRSRSSFSDRNDLIQYIKSKNNIFPSLRKHPEENDIILFKVLKMDASYNPSLSDYICGEVKSICNTSSQLELDILYGLEELKPPKGKFSLEDEEENSEVGLPTLQSLNWNELYETCRVPWSN